MVEMKPRKFVNKAAARTPEAYEGIEIIGRIRTLKATTILAQGTHGAPGHSYITGEHEGLDYYIYLNDDRGQFAALTIEFGRQNPSGMKRDKNGRIVTPSRAVAPLRRAVDLY